MRTFWKMLVMSILVAGASLAGSQYHTVFHAVAAVLCVIELRIWDNR